ncbi:MAG: ABC transporter ATP-binding protein/permease [Actinomycetota bacterium]|nr:ABC transporter ATP-binding protein/permease [Actinomycetota bacterium]
MPRPRNAVLRRGFRLIGQGIRTQPRIFTAALVGSALFGSMSVASAYVMGAVTGRVILPAFAEGRASAGALALASLAIIGVAILKILGIIGRRLCAGIMQYRLQAEYRRQVTRQYLRLPLSWHQQHPTGQLLSNANSDVEAAWFFVAPLPFACGALLMLVITIVALFLTDPVLAIVGGVVIPLVFVVNIAYSRVMSPRISRAQQLRAEVSEIAHESFDAALVVKTLGREQREIDRFAERTAALRDCLISVGRIRGLFDPIMESLPTLATLAVLTLGVGRVASGETATEDLVFIAYLFTVLALPIRALGWVLGELPRAVAGNDRVTDVLTAAGQTTYGAKALPSEDGPARLATEDVDFQYSGEQTRSLVRITMDVPAGRSIAIVGPTGSGKSTLANLLVRLVDPDSGVVLVDDIDVRGLRQGELTRDAALVSQSTFLFDDTVAGNVTLGADYDADLVWEALRLAAAEDFVKALPDGLDTQVGERGATLSGGQRQRIALARALVRRPRLLVMDDATSSVDPTVESRILSGLRTAGWPATVAVIAYRKATITLADEVVFLADGRILARGGHADLERTVPGYAALVQAYDGAVGGRAGPAVIVAGVGMDHA